MNQFCRVLENCSLLRNSFSNIVYKRSLMSLPQPHIYKKTWKEDELLQYLRDNVVYECDDYFITSLPQAIGMLEKTWWWHHENVFIHNVRLSDLIKKLGFDFQSNTCRAVLYPGRSASGLAVLAKSLKSRNYLKSNITQNACKGNLILTLLAVVLGHPDRVFTQEFGIRVKKSEKGLSTEIRDISLTDKKCKRVNYQHEVLDSTEHVSLVKVEVSSNINDCVRHILSQRCYTHVLGDFWSIRRKKGLLFGIPLVRDLNVPNNASSLLHPDLHEKLQLEPDEEKFIPCHLHLFSMKLQLKKNTDLFAAVPPPEYFIWTCRQLGLHEIEKFSFKTAERNEVAIAQD